MRGLAFAYVCVLIAVAFVAFASKAYTADGPGRRNQRAREADPSDANNVARCIRDAVRMGRAPDPRVLIRADRSALDTSAGRVFLAKDHRPPRPEHLQNIDPEWQAEAEGWYNPGARELQPGDQFVTRNGGHRWTKVVAGQKEVWRGPDGLLIGDVVGQMTHFDAQRIDRALKALFDQAKKDVSGQWRWSEGFDPAVFLRHEMSRSVNAADLPGGDPHGNGSHDVAQFYEPLMESMGRILEPDVPWRLPVQKGAGIENPGPTREFSALRNQSALEVLNDTSGLWFWSSSVHADYSNGAHNFDGGRGNVGAGTRYVGDESVRLVARVR